MAACHAPVGKMACWPQTAPVHISDGGGPTDQVWEERVLQIIQAQIDSLLPRLNYHPLLLPKPRGINLDPQTMDILVATHIALNASNPSLASDCWLCLALGASWPLVIPLLSNETVAPSHDNCNNSKPFNAIPNSFNEFTCLYSTFKNESFDADLGAVMFTSCKEIINSSALGCLGRGRVYVCGDNIAYPFLPVNWTGSCALSLLLPDIEIIQGDEPIPLPSFDMFIPR